MKNVRGSGSLAIPLVVSLGIKTVSAACGLDKYLLATNSLHRLVSYVNIDPERSGAVGGQITGWETRADSTQTQEANEIIQLQNHYAHHVKTPNTVMFCINSCIQETFREVDIFHGAFNNHNVTYCLKMTAPATTNRRRRLGFSTTQNMVLPSRGTTFLLTRYDKTVLRNRIGRNVSN